MANPILEALQKNGKLDPMRVGIFILILVVSAWAFSRLFGRTNYTVTKSMGKENLEIITTDNAIPNTPVSKVPLKALGVLAQNNHRRYLPGFDIEGDAPN